MNDTVPIETNFPVPKRQQDTLPFDKMEIGNSIFVADGTMKSSTMTQLAAYANRTFSPKRFTARRQGAGYRIWRIE